MRFPTLYKKTSTGADQMWSIESRDIRTRTMFPGSRSRLGSERTSNR
jgi:hypothetical protein